MFDSIVNLFLIPTFNPIISVNIQLRYINTFNEKIQE